MSSLSDLAVFVAVVECGSFTAAAEKLEQSKAATSKAVGNLESRLGARLLNRTTRRLSLTEAGAALYDRVGGAMADIVAAESEIMELTGTPRGRLRVTAPIYFGNVHLMPAVCSFLRQYPDIELELDLDNKIVDIVERRVDVAIRITTLLDSSMVARRLADVSLVTVASPEYLARYGTPREPNELKNHAGLTYSLLRAPNEWHFLHDGEPVSVHVRSVLRCNSDDALKHAALDGLGVTRFPEIFIVEELNKGRLVRILEDFEPPPSSLCAVFPTRANMPPKVRVFVDFLADHFKRT